MATISLIGLLLMLAAWRDVVARIIPDLLVLPIAILGIAGRLSLGWGVLLEAALTALLLFVILLACAMRGWLGGGDVKLAAALAIGLPPAATWDFVVATTLAGGLLALGYLNGPRLAPRLASGGATTPFGRILAVEAWRLRRGGPLPYGVAIAAGGLVTLLALREG
ncbi:A24 family peptidase [Belnapia rosea]|uniref:A24 family peptidase n=1 Tax=Belnapia rosea TaxID=938405 RepID=UPI000884E32D|nr:prepilin peptidase CpaA [Belnapia rosea]